MGNRVAIPSSINRIQNMYELRGEKKDKENVEEAIRSSLFWLRD